VSRTVHKMHTVGQNLLWTAHPAAAVKSSYWKNCHLQGMVWPNWAQGKQMMGHHQPSEEALKTLAACSVRPVQRWHPQLYTSHPRDVVLP